MSAPKRTTQWALLANVEPSYLGAVTLTAGADAVLVTERPDVEIDYVHDGKRNGFNPGTPSELPLVAKSGRFGKIKAVMEAQGFGAAYSASNVPSIHRLMRIAGFDGAVVTTGGAEKWTYTPTAEGSYISGKIEAYLRGQKHSLTGLYFDTMKISGAQGAVPKFEFDGMGVAAMPTDVALPAATYAAPFTIDPAKLEAMTLTIGTGTPFVPLRVKSFDVEWSRGVTPRAFDNSAGAHGGFNPGRRMGKLTCVVEAVALETAGPYYTATTFNPYQLAELATKLGITFNIGGTQYKKWQFSCPSAQLTGKPEAEDGTASMFSLSFDLQPSGYTTNDELSFIFN